VTVIDRTSVRIRKDKSHISDSENGQTGADCTLARFDTSNSRSSINENEKDQNPSNTKNSSTEGDRFFPRNLRSDPQHVLDGMLALECLFCNTMRHQYRMT
jgi:hypothetical protein